MKKYTVFSLLVALAVTGYVGCKSDEKPPETNRKFIETAYFDSTVKPGDNFFMFVNGGWLKTAEIPSTESGIGAFLDLRNKTREALKGLLEDAAKSNAAKGSLEQKVGDFYTSGMDSAAIESRGYDPVKPELEKISSIKDAKDIMKYVADEQKSMNSILFGTYVGADEKNSAKNILIFYQGGLGLPDRDYYFKTDAATKAVVDAYMTYMKKLFTLTGDDSATAAKKAAAVYTLEKQMAGSHKTNVELRDPESNYHKMAVADLNKKMPVFGFSTLLDNMNIKTDSVNVGQPAFYEKVNVLLTSVPVDTWKDYLRFHTIDAASDALSSDFVNANFEYNGKALTGQQQIKPRWQRMASSTDNYLGEALGQLYVKKYFTEDAKKRMQDLVNNLQKAFEQHINQLDWMSDSTKVEAKAKLETFLKKIGYPDKWRDYSKVDIEKDKFYENLQSAARNEYAYQTSKIGKLVDRTEWGMTPPTINAYYNPTFNEIVFPAGILQFPFFDPNADDAINYGGIGMVIGHEMTHGFDDQGAQYDKDGNMKLWWSKEDYSKFQKKANQVINQYNGFTVLDSLHVNGSLTNGENIADLGGISIAYDAFKMTPQGKDTTRIDGFTPDQRFFISLAQIWRSKLKDERARQLINVDPHSPAIWRVNGPLMNFQPFYAAFNVQPGDKMYLPDSSRIEIW